MNWLFWLLIGWWTLGVLLTVGGIGKPRKPINNATAVTTIVVHAILIVLLIVGWPA